MQTKLPVTVVPGIKFLRHGKIVGHWIVLCEFALFCDLIGAGSIGSVEKISFVNVADHRIVRQFDQRSPFPTLIARSLHFATPKALELPAV